MAHLFQKQKGGGYYVRFRYDGDYYKRSLDTTELEIAEDRRLGIERMLKRLASGRVQMPLGVEPGEFIVSEGAVLKPHADRASDLRTLTQLRDDYLSAQENRISPAYLSAQRTHLKHLCAALGDKAHQSCDHITARDLEKFIEGRLAIRDPNTVIRERVTTQHFFRWLYANGHISIDPAASLATIKGGRDLPPFRTKVEIERIIARGGLSEDAVRELWECLYLTSEEIAQLLLLVRERSQEEASIKSHIIPAYTGMRRGEILRLTWLDVNLDDGFITARSRKQSRSQTEVRRTIDLHPELRDELAAWRDRQSAGQFVICKPGTLEPVDKDLANRLFWQPLRGTEWCLDSKKNRFKLGFHCYRHSFASNLAALGVDQLVIDELMGHTTAQMTARYRHLFPNTRRAAIECFSLRAKAAATSA